MAKLGNKNKYLIGEDYSDLVFVYSGKAYVKRGTTYKEIDFFNSKGSLNIKEITDVNQAKDDGIYSIGNDIFFRINGKNIFSNGLNISKYIKYSKENKVFGLQNLGLIVDNIDKATVPAITYDKETSQFYVVTDKEKYSLKSFITSTYSDNVEEIVKRILNSENINFTNPNFKFKIGGRDIYSIGNEGYRFHSNVIYDRDLIGDRWSIINEGGKSTLRIDQIIFNDSLLAGKDGKYTEIRYKYHQGTPELPVGREPLGWTLNPENKYNLVDTRIHVGFIAHSFNKFQATFYPQMEAELYNEVIKKNDKSLTITVRLEGKVSTGNMITVSVYNLSNSGDIRFYKSFNEHFNSIHTINVSGASMILRASVSKRTPEPNEEDYIRVTRINPSTCWETRAIIDPKLHDGDQATEAPKWSPPIISKENTYTVGLYPKNTLIQKINDTSVHPEVFTITNRRSNGSGERTNFVIFLGNYNPDTNRMEWVKGTSIKNSVSINIYPNTTTYMYKIRSYDWLDEKIDYNSSYIDEAYGVLSVNGKDGKNGTDGNDGKNSPMTSIPTKWDPEATYIGGDDYASIVYLEFVDASGKKKYQYYRALKNVPKNIHPENDPNKDEYWAKINTQTELAIHNAFIKELIANEIFVNELKAIQLDVNQINIGKTPAGHPEQYFAQINPEGEGHLAGGKFRFTQDSVSMEGAIKSGWIPGKTEPITGVVTPGRFTTIINEKGEGHLGDGGLKFTKDYVTFKTLQYNRKEDGKILSYLQFADPKYFTEDELTISLGDSAYTRVNKLKNIVKNKRENNGVLRIKGNLYNYDGTLFQNSIQTHKLGFASYNFLKVELNEVFYRDWEDITDIIIGLDLNTFFEQMRGTDNIFYDYVEPSWSGDYYLIPVMGDKKVMLLENKEKVSLQGLHFNIKATSGVKKTIHILDPDPYKIFYILDTGNMELYLKSKARKTYPIQKSIIYPYMTVDNSYFNFLSIKVSQGGVDTYAGARFIGRDIYPANGFDFSKKEKAYEGSFKYSSI